MKKILIACGDVDLLRKVASDLPRGTYKPVATKSGDGIAQKIAGRGIELAIVHQTLQDMPGAQLASELKTLAPAPRILFLSKSDVPNSGPFDHAIRYPVPGPILRNALNNLSSADSAEEDLERWRAFYDEINTRLAQIESESYYAMFGVKPSAPHHLIVKVFDSLSYRYHPDRYQQHRKQRWGQAIYEQVNSLYKAYTEAFEVLSDRRLRKKYDEVLRTGQLRLDKDSTKKDSGPTHLNEFARQPTTKKFLNLAQTDLARADLENALQNLKFALSLEPDNEAIKAKIQELEAKLP